MIELWDRTSDVLAGLVVQLARFAVVGIANTALSLAVFVMLSEAGLSVVAAAALAFVVGAANGYVWNRRWTFGAADSGRARLRYALVQLAALGLTTSMMDALSRAPLASAVAYLLTTATATVTAFTANRQWTFEPRR